MTTTVTEGTTEITDPGALPEGVFHLLIADDDLCHSYAGVVTVCGEVVSMSALPPSCYPAPEDKADDEPDRDPLFCPACVRVAVRLSADGDRECSGVGR